MGQIQPDICAADRFLGETQADQDRRAHHRCRVRASSDGKIVDRDRSDQAEEHDGIAGGDLGNAPDRRGETTSRVRRLDGKIAPEREHRARGLNALPRIRAAPSVRAAAQSLLGPARIRRGGM